jgi:predicted GIY-YIG superfamily endonuclease
VSDGEESTGWWVYLLRCGDGTCYTGITTDVQRRLAEHASGKGARYTRGRQPVTLLGTVPCASRSAAARLEARLRRLPPETKLGIVRREGS